MANGIRGRILHLMETHQGSLTSSKMTVVEMNRACLARTDPTIEAKNLNCRHITLREPSNKHSRLLLYLEHYPYNSSTKRFGISHSENLETPCSIAISRKPLPT